MEITLVNTSDLKHYARNRKTHPEDQIERLAYLIIKNGFRDPLIVDKQTMEVVAGNGTLMACKKLGMKQIPCVLEFFESDEVKYAFSVSHNAIQGWSDIDLAGIHADLGELGPFDIDQLGVKNFQFEPVGDAPNIDDFMDADKQKIKFFTCPHCQQEFEEKQATVRTI